ncbi:MAG: threonine ammonia-lyase IlvA [Cyclobacteriaceae bacterium]
MATRDEPYNVLPAEAPELHDIMSAAQNLKEVVIQSPLQKNLNFSDRFESNVYFKREDLQVVRSYKLRGAYHKIASLNETEKANGIACASAGNHGQGVAYSCQKLGIKGVIFMPSPTPKQKIKQVRMFGKDMVEVRLVGDTFDDARNAANDYCKDHNVTFIHPFDDKKVVEGQATVALEILQDIKEKIDYLFVPVGGGGLASGIISVFQEMSPTTKIIGVEPEGAPAMKLSIENGKNTTLDKIDTFVDGAAVKRVGDLNFEICKHHLDDVVLVPEGKICSTILQLYNEEAIITEPAGTLSISALDFYKEEIKGKTVVCIASGSNNDITRTEEIKERSLLYEGLKHYFIIRFPQRAGALREFVNDVLSPDDDIVHFEYSKKHSRERGPALIGIELQKKENLKSLLSRMEEKNFFFEYLNDKQDLLQYLI